MIVPLKEEFELEVMAPQQASSLPPRLVIGAGYPSSGVTALVGVLQRLPNACEPKRTELNFWSGTSRYGAEQTRHTYLDRLRWRWADPCSLAWEVSERYGSLEGSSRRACYSYMYNFMTFRYESN